jgi:hypothetical protein
MTKNSKYRAGKKNNILNNKKLLFTYPWATREAISSLKRTSSPSIHEMPSVFSIFVGHFYSPDPDPAVQYVNTDPCGSGSESAKIDKIIL